MGRKYTWAYINTTAEGDVAPAEGEFGSIQTKDFDGGFKGHANFRYLTSSTTPPTSPLTTHVVKLTGDLAMSGDIHCTGSIYARNYYIKNVGFMDLTGSTKFGDSLDDTHDIRGDVTLNADSTLYFNAEAGSDNIVASSAGHLEINAGSTLDITAPTVHVNAATKVDIDAVAFDLDTSHSVTIDCSNTTHGVNIATATSGVPVTIGHSTSETTVRDNLTVTGDIDCNGRGLQITRTSTEHSPYVSLRMYDTDGIADGGDVGAVRWYASEDDSNYSQMGYVLVEADEAFDWDGEATGARMKFGLTENATRNNPVNRMELDNAGNLQIDGDLTVTGNDIKGSGGGAAITMDGSNHVTIPNNLTVTGESTFNDHVKINQDDGQYGLHIDQTGDEVALKIDSDQNKSCIRITPTAMTSNAGIRIETDGITGGDGIKIADTGTGTMTSGHMLYIKSTSADTTGRHLVYIKNESTSATGAQCLKVLQEASDVNAFNFEGPDGNILKGSDKGVIIGTAATSLDSALHVRSSSDTTAPRIKINAGNTAAQRDPSVHFYNDGVAKFNVGTDGSDSDTFKISAGAAVGTNTVFEANTSGELTKLGDDTPSTNEVLTWDGNKAVWSSATGTTAESLVAASGDVTITAEDGVKVYLDSNDGATYTAFSIYESGESPLQPVFIADEKGTVKILNTPGHSRGARLWLSSSVSSNMPSSILMDHTRTGNYSAGDNLAGFYFRAQENNEPNISKATMLVEVADGTAGDQSAETWVSGSAHGTQFKFTTTPVGSATLTDRFLIDGAGVVVNGRIYGPADDHLRIKSDKGIHLHMDDDDSADGEDGDHNFRVYNGSDTIMIEASEAGNFSVTGDLTVSGHDILNSDSETCITLHADQKVGIGGVVPTHMLDVNGDIKVRGNDIRDSSGDIAIHFDGQQNTQLKGDLTGPTNDPFYIKSDAGLIFRIDANESTTPDTSHFRVRNGADSIIFNVDEAGLAEVTSLQVGGGFGSTGVTISNAGAISANGNILGAAGTFTSLQSNGTISADGQLTLQNTLNAKGDVGDPDDYALLIQHNSSDNNKGPGIGFQATTDDTQLGAAIIHEKTDTYSKGHLHFYTKKANTDGTAPTRTMSLTDSGKALIGDVDGSGTTSGKFTVYDKSFDALADVGDPTNYHLALKRHATDNGTGPGISFISTDASDKVGAAIIHKRTDSASKGSLNFYTKQATGTADPTEILRLTDDGKVQITQGTISGPDTGPLYLKSEAGIILHLDEDTGDNSYFRVYNHADQSVFEVNEFGGVGIGLTTAGTAAERLHVKGSSVDMRTRLETDDGYDLVYTGYQGSTQKMSVGYDDDVDLVSLSYGEMANHHITIDSSGDVAFHNDIEVKNIHSQAASSLQIRADNHVLVDIDEQNNRDFAKFAVRDGGGNQIFTVQSGSTGSGNNINMPAGTDAALYAPRALTRVGNASSYYSVFQVEGQHSSLQVYSRNSIPGPEICLIGNGGAISDEMVFGSIKFYADESDGVPADSGTDIAAQIRVKAVHGAFGDFTPNSDMPTRMDFLVGKDGSADAGTTLSISGHNSVQRRVGVCGADYDPPARFSIKQVGTDSTAIQGAVSGMFIEEASGNDGWALHVDNYSRLQFSFSNDGLSTIETTGGYLNDASDVTAIDFTGQHRNYGDAELYDPSSVGLIVSSTGQIKNLDLSTTAKINEALPELSLSTQGNDKRVFGVISDSEDENDNERLHQLGIWGTRFEKEDNRLIVNSLGEGAVWVCDINGNLDNGDYITTCTVPGHGALQADDLLHNYTVAKITQDCTFDLNSTEYVCEEYEHNGTTYKRAFVACTYHCG